MEEIRAQQLVALGVRPALWRKTGGRQSVLSAAVSLKQRLEVQVQPQHEGARRAGQRLLAVLDIGRATNEKLLFADAGHAFRIDQHVLLALQHHGLDIERREIDTAHLLPEFAYQKGFTSVFGESIGEVNARTALEKTELSQRKRWQMKMMRSHGNAIPTRLLARISGQSAGWGSGSGSNPMNFERN